MVKKALGVLQSRFQTYGWASFGRSVCSERLIPGKNIKGERGKRGYFLCFIGKFRFEKESRRQISRLCAGESSSHL